MIFDGHKGKGRYKFRMPAEKAEVIIKKLRESGHTTINTRNPKILSLSSDDPNHYTTIVEYYPGQTAKYLIENSQAYNLLDFPKGTLQFTFDKRDEQPVCLVKMNEASLSIIEKDAYICRSRYKHNRKEVLFTPVKVGHPLHCRQCGSLLSLQEYSLFPDIREMLLEAEKFDTIPSDKKHAYNSCS